MELNVVCFLWNGDRWNGSHDGEEYVNRLYRGVQRNLTLPHKFICLVDKYYPKINPKIAQLKIYTNTWMGCLPKISMFDPRLGLKGQVFSLDIDLVITGSLNDMCSYRGNFCTRSKFRKGMEFKIDGDIVGFNVNSENVKKVWNDFYFRTDYVEQITGGRERYWYRNIFKREEIDIWQDLYPNQIYSYKQNICRTNILPRTARIVSFHGHPRPDSLLNINWIKDNWK